MNTHGNPSDPSSDPSSDISSISSNTGISKDQETQSSETQVKTTRDTSKTRWDVVQDNNVDMISNLGIFNNDLRILYITLAIIIGILLLWIVIVVLTKEDPIKILGQMNSLTFQTPAVTDVKLNIPITSHLDTPLTTSEKFGSRGSLTDDSLSF